MQSGTTRSFTRCSNLSALGLTLLWILSAVASQASTAPRGPQLFFEGNRGQLPETITYVARGPGYRLLLGPGGATYDLGASGDAQQVRVVPVNGRAPSRILASQPLPGKINYFRGNDPERWIVGAPTFGRVTLEGIYPGIDMVYRAHGTRAEYDFVVAAGADPSRIELFFEGAGSARVDEAGRLLIRAGDGVLRTAAPVAYQERGGRRQLVPVAFLATDDGHIRFRLGNHDPARALVIDPVVLDYSTSFGGSGVDDPKGLQVGSDGTIYVAGTSDSNDFLGAPGANSGMQDIFVTRLSADGSTLLYTSFIGGMGSDFALDLAVDAAGDAYVAGQTESGDYPVVNEFEDMLGGARDYAVTRLDGSGTIVYSTYYGGSQGDGAGDDGGIALAPNGDVYITGRNNSLPAMGGLPLLNEYESTCQGTFCGFVAGFDTDLSGASSHVYGTYVNGTGDDGGQDIDIDGAGLLYVFGFTSSDAGLVTASQAFQPVTNDANNNDNFLVVLDTSQTTSAQLVYSTYIGSPDQEEEPRGSVFVESPGAVYVTGSTNSAGDAVPAYANGFPIKNAVQSTNGGSEDGYLVKVDTTTTGNASLLFSTFLGGSASDTGHDVVTDSTGRIHVAGRFSNSVAPLAEFSGFSGAYVQLDATGQTIETATPLPAGFRVAVDADDHALVSGRATTASFAKVGPQQTSVTGMSEVFLGRLDPLALTGATLTVEASTSHPEVGDDFAYLFTLTNNGAQDITDFTITGGFPGGLSTVASSLCFGSITCQPADPGDFTGADAILPNERLTLFVEASSAATGSFDIAALTATTTPVDPDASDNTDGTDVEVVTTAPTTGSLRIADFDASGLSADTGGFSADTPFGVLASGNGVQDETANFMVFDGGIDVTIQDIYSRGKVAVGVVERSNWTPANGDGLSLLDIDSGFGTVDRVYVQFMLVGRGPVARAQLRSGNAGSASVLVPGQDVLVDLDPDDVVSIAVDTGAQTATVSYGGSVILSGNPFSTVLTGGADVGDVGDDMVVSVGGGRLDLGGALLPEPSIGTLQLFGGLAVIALHRRRRRRSRR